MSTVDSTEPPAGTEPNEPPTARAAGGPRGGGPPGGSAFGERTTRRRISVRAAGTDGADDVPISFLPVSDTLADHRRNVTSGPASIPGGRVTLPRIDGPDEPGEPDVQFVGTAFVRRGPAIEQPTPAAGFEQYFTYESLFAEPAAEATVARPDPHEVLEVERSSPWPEVVAAHRRLVKENHPDHLADAPAEVRSAAEERLRLINSAFAEIRRAQLG